MRPPQELLYESESSLRLVDKAIEELRSESGESIDVSDAERHVMAAALREELSILSNHLQVQDMTSQQLQHLAALVGEMRSRLDAESRTSA